MRREFLTLIICSIGVALLLAVLSGCGTVPAIPATVAVAVPQPCDAPVPDKPVFPAEALTGAEDIFTLGKTLWADLKARQAYELKLRTALEGCTGKLPEGGGLKPPK